MKKILATALTALAVVFTGCDKEPTVDEMMTTATACGTAAGYIANQAKIDTQSRGVVIQIMNKVSEVVPAVDQSFDEAWGPIAKEVTNKLVAEGKIDQGQALLINSAVSVACKGLDYLVTVRYPKAKKYENLVSAGVKGFTSGFLAVFQPTDKVVKTTKDVKYDKAAYDYIMSKMNTKK